MTKYADAEQVESLVARAQAGDQKAHTKLLQKFDGLIHRAARKFYHEGTDYFAASEDAVQEACIGFTKAVKSYDRARTHTGFPPHAAVEMRNHLWRWRFVAARLVQLPPSWIQYQKTKPELMQGEFSLHALEAEYAEAIVEDSAERVDVEQELIREDQREQLRRRVQRALRQLSSRDRDIVCSRFMQDAPALQKQLGEKYGISRVRVAQLEQRAMRFLRERLSDYAK